MTFEQIIQKVGKEIELSVLYEENGVASVIGYDDIKRAKITFNCGLTGSVMNGIELELYTALPDVPITLSVTAKFGEDTATKLYQNYHFKETPTYNADTKTYTHILYDEMINLMVEYQPITITYPTTLIQFFQRLVTELNLTTDIISLPNGNRTIAQDLYTGINYTYRDVLDDIGQATGTLFKVNNKNIEKCTLGNTPKIVNDDILKNQNISMGQHFGAINVIVLSRSGGSDNIYFPETLPENPIEYKISDNILMNDNNRVDYLQELYSALAGIQYDIYDCQLIGYGGFEPLDKVQIQTYEDNVLKYYNSYVFNNEIVMNGGGYEESIYTELPEETNTEYQYADTTDKRINQTYLIVDKQNGTIEGVVSEVNGQNSKITKISGDVEEIKMEISNISGMTMSQEGYGTINFEETTTASAPVSMIIHPVVYSISNLYPNFSLYPTSQSYPAQVGLVPSGSLTPSSSLVPSTGYPAQEIKYPKVRNVIFHNKTNNTDIPYPLPDDLLYYDAEHYDEFRYDYKSKTCQVVKKCKYNADGTIGLLQNERIDDYSQGGTVLPEINLSEGKYSVYIQGVSGAFLNVTLMAKNIYTDQFYTKHETDSYVRTSIEQVDIGNYDWYTDINGRVTGNSGQITVNSRAITAEVQARTDADGDLSSRIKQTARSIELGVNDNGTSCGITIKLKNEDGTQLDEKSGNITLSGLVKFTDLSGTGTTTINGANIQTGTLNADKINGGAITGSEINLGNGNFAVDTNGNATFKSGSIKIRDYLSVSNNGRVLMRSSSGFLTMGATVHPYVSAINIAKRTDGIAFVTGTESNSAGEMKAKIGINDSYNLRIENLNNNIVLVTNQSSGNVNISTHHMRTDTLGYFTVSAGSSYSPGTYNGSIYIYAQESISLNAKNGHVYAGAGSTSNSRIAVDSSGPSSRCLKKNIKEFKNNDYKDALKLLNDMQIYSYDYKYNISKNENQYGFIIDDLLDNEYAKKFLYFKDDKAVVIGKDLNYQLAEEEPNNKDIIEFKTYDEPMLIKYMLVTIKALQKEIEELKK